MSETWHNSSWQKSVCSILFDLRLKSPNDKIYVLADVPNKYFINTELDKYAGSFDILGEEPNGNINIYKFIFDKKSIDTKDLQQFVDARNELCNCFRKVVICYLYHNCQLNFKQSNMPLINFVNKSYL